MIIEVCVDSIISVEAAAKGGSDRIELCGNLSIGGTTPSTGLMKISREKYKGPIHALIRPRAGDFCYNSYEVEEMINSINEAKEFGLEGVVIGVLTPQGIIDEDIMRQLINVARPMQVTCHRAFDMTRDLKEALNTCIKLGVDYILTSGGANNAFEGLDNICDMVKLSNGAVKIMPGAGISIDNVEEIIKVSGVEQIHLSAKKTINGPMVFKNSNVSMGIKGMLDEYERVYTDEEILKIIVNKIKLS